MPRRNNRTPEEEEEFARLRRLKNAERQRRYRARQREIRNEIIETENLSPEQEFQHLRRQRRAEDQQRRRTAQRNAAIDTIRHITEHNEHYIGEMNILCIHCNAKHFEKEKVANKGCSFNDCCSHGKVKVDKLNDFPEYLKTLLNGEQENSNNFFQKIRYYNNSLSFASFNANLRDFSNQRPGPYCFVIHGQIYYQINTSFYAAPNETPSNGQLFIIDQDQALTYRMNQSSDLDETIMTNLDTLIRNNNLHAKSYQMMNVELKKQAERREQLGTENTEELNLMFTSKPELHPGRYNPQQSNEVAAIFTTSSDGEIPETCVTVRVKSSKELKCVSSMDPNVEPWIYPLFYPTGKQGWHRDLKQQNSDRRISRCQYVRDVMAIRDTEFNPFIMGRRLFQQWIVDNWVKIERDRIEWCRENQKKLRAYNYKSLINSIDRRANDNGARLGKIVILPSTFSGSPRNMLQNYQDAMTIVRKYGEPDLFITMTCNPNWREITENLYPGQSPSDRPDLIARVFNLKKDHLINLIVEKQFFGKVIAYIYVIEFQKRGLPHMHLLVTLASDNKLNTAEKIDKYISAQFPTDDESLKALVLKHMVHTCGNWCQVNGQCSKHFPKNFQNETTFDEKGIPLYKRVNAGQTYVIRNNNRTVDNRDVVAHNGDLLKIFNWHINVVAVASLLAVKYLFKYVYKGHDRAAVYVTNQGNESLNNHNENVINHDEPTQFIDTRYVGASEACWRVLEKRMHGRSHSISRLSIHLPGEQNIYINEEGNIEDFLNNLNKMTMLQAYFELNSTDESAREHLYMDIPLYYTFDKDKRKWHKRQRYFNVIGRIYSVSPSQTELFHLRMLLLNKSGARSFEELRTVDNHMYPTFVEACLAMGLIENDDEWKKAIHEASIWMMPKHLRHLFVSILIHCNPLYPDKLWEDFKSLMSEDHSRHYSTEIAESRAYSDINSMLIAEGSSLSRFPRLQQEIEYFEDNDISENISDEDSATVGNRQYALLNEKQKEIVDMVLNLVSNDDIPTQNIDDYTFDNCIYIIGIGGSGKTFIYSTLYHLLKAHNIKMNSMAFTGIAAILLPKGKTVHRTFRLPVPLHPDSTSNIKLQSKEAEDLKNAKVLVWDEAPMAPRYALEIVDKSLKDIMNNEMPFGGKIVILGGDDRQLLPVKQNSTRSEIVDLSLKSSKLWKFFRKFTLTENMRVLPDEKEFCEYLKNIGDGTSNDENDYVEIPSECIASENNDIVREIYGDIIEEQSFKKFATCAILAARNIDVDDSNEQVLDLLDETGEKTFTSIDNVDDREGCNREMMETLTQEFLNSLEPRSLPPHKLKIRKNCVLMLIRNLNSNEGLCNGTRVRVEDFSDLILKCEILNGDKTGDMVFIHRITLYCDNEYPFTFKRRQFPVRMAFAMSINKAQGQTLEKVGIDLRKEVFTHGQLYVAMSRAKSQKGVKIFINRTNTTDNKVKNIVFKEVFVN